MIEKTKNIKTYQNIIFFSVSNSLASLSMTHWRHWRRVKHINWYRQITYFSERLRIMSRKSILTAYILTWYRQIFSETSLFMISSSKWSSKKSFSIFYCQSLSVSFNIYKVQTIIDLHLRTMFHSLTAHLCFETVQANSF